MKTVRVFKSEKGKNAVLEAYAELLARWPVPYEELLIPTQYGSTYAIVCGEKQFPPLVLLHGTGSNSTMWIGDMTEYSRHYLLYALDIPGEPGKSGDDQYPMNSPIYAQWLEEVLNALSLPSVTLVGLSLGGWMSLNYSVRHPERIVKLVLLCPSGIGPAKLSFLLSALPLMLFGEKGIDQVTRMVNGNRDVPAETLRYSRILSASFNVRTEPVPIFTDNELKRLTMPVMVLAGDMDVLLHSRKTVERIKQLLPQAEAHLLPDTGHVLVNVTDRIVPFLLG